MTSLLTLAVALATPAQAVEAPNLLEVGNVIATSWPGEQGRYERAADDGDSDCGCWVREDGAFALARFGGGWWSLDNSNGDGCTPSYGTSAGLIAYSSSTDPSTLPEVTGLRYVELEISGDDAYIVTVDGVQELYVPEHGWTYSEVLGLTLPQGTHDIEVEVWDRYFNVNGFIAAITIEGDEANPVVTGSGAWQLEEAWYQGYNYSGFGDVFPIYDYPVAKHGGLEDSGAEWVWWYFDATLLGRGVFSLELVVP